MKEVKWEYFALKRMDVAGICIVGSKAKGQISVIQTDFKDRLT